MLLTVIVLNKL